MTWVKIDDKFVRHHKVQQISDKAFRLHVAALCNCSDMLTDGRVTERDVRMLAPLISATSWKRYVNELISTGLWTVEAHGWSINDYLDYNPSSVRVREQRERNAARQARHRNGVTNGVSHSAPTRTPYIQRTTEPLVPKDVTSEVDAENVLDLRSVLKGI